MYVYIVELYLGGKFTIIFGDFSFLLFSLHLILFGYMYLCVCLCGYLHASEGALRLEEDIRGPGAGVTGSCNPHDVGSGNQTGSCTMTVHPVNRRATSPALTFGS